MRLILISGFAIILAFNTQAQVAVPNSTSPDGKTALYYVHLPSTPMDEGYELYFRHAQSLLPLCENLIPKRHTGYTTEAAMDDQDSDILLGGICFHIETTRLGQRADPAFTYDIAWSPDSQWVDIEGGAHKFYRAMFYHLVDGRFRRVMFPDAQFGKYFDAHKNDLHVPDLGALAAIHKISPRTYDYPCVCWLGNGIPAINAYPYLLGNPDYGKLGTHALFFVLNLRTHPATITGFCK